MRLARRRATSTANRVRQRADRMAQRGLWGKRAEAGKIPHQGSRLFIEVACGRRLAARDGNNGTAPESSRATSSGGGGGGGGGARPRPRGERTPKTTSSRRGYSAGVRGSGRRRRDIHTDRAARGWRGHPARGRREGPLLLSAAVSSRPPSLQRARTVVVGREHGPEAVHPARSGCWREIFVPRPGSSGRAPSPSSRRCRVRPSGSPRRGRVLGIRRLCPQVTLERPITASSSTPRGPCGAGAARGERPDSSRRSPPAGRRRTARRPPRSHRRVLERQGGVGARDLALASLARAARRRARRGSAALRPYAAALARPKSDARGPIGIGCLMRRSSRCCPAGSGSAG
jgi:hypothetical protein